MAVVCHSYSDLLNWVGPYDGLIVYRTDLMMRDRSGDSSNDPHPKNQENAISLETEVCTSNARSDTQVDLRTMTGVQGVAPLHGFAPRSSHPTVRGRSNRVVSPNRQGGRSSGYSGCVDPRSDLQAPPDMLNGGEVHRACLRSSTQRDVSFHVLVQLDQGMVAPKDLLRRRNARLVASLDPFPSSEPSGLVEVTPRLTKERRKGKEKASDTSRRGEKRGANVEPLDSRLPKFLHISNSRPPRSVGSETGQVKLVAQSDNLLRGVNVIGTLGLLHRVNCLIIENKTFNNLKSSVRLLGQLLLLASSEEVEEDGFNKGIKSGFDELEEFCKMLFLNVPA
ncbi:hypothetical protein Droror1_Dr00024917 [Drosera rotundifolia]